MVVDITVDLDEEVLYKMRCDLRKIDYSEIKSSHLAEAIARGLGFNTHASLLAYVRSLREQCLIEKRALNTPAMDEYLSSLGYENQEAE